ncbi:MAG: hypothetical protein PHP23_11050 [Desulfobacterales bacterium]|nr:hypothetical protein [Desulfobacterales bacterium]
MLIEELGKKSKQKPEFDWEKYYEWQLQQDGGRQLCQPHPVLWKCPCGAKNASCDGVHYDKCQRCGRITPSRKG